MPPVRLTTRVVDGLEPRDKVTIIFDGELRGFGVRITPAGAKSWIVEYRAGGGGRSAPTRRITLGSVSQLSSEKARKAAKDILAAVRLGADPAAERAERRRSGSVADLIGRFMAEEIRPKRKPRTAELYEAQFRLHVIPEIGSKRARDVTAADIGRLHRKIGARSPVTANRVVTLLSGFFRWAGSPAQGEVPEGFNPAKGIEKFREQGRERYLTSDEFARLGEAIREAETIGLPYEVDDTRPTAKHNRKPENRRVKIDPFAAAAIRLLLFTGARLREILHLRWDEVDFERGMLWLSDSKTGPKPIVLNAPARAVLTKLPRIGRYVIAGLKAGDKNEKPRADLNAPWRSVRNRAGLAGVRLHDLRHSFASVGAGRSLGLPIIGKLLGHRSQETTSKYAHLDADPLRAASNRIGADIAAALGEAGQAGGVVPFNRGGAAP